MEDMQIIEAQWLSSEEAPTDCSYCKTAKMFLMEKPEFYAVNQKLYVNVNLTGNVLWICLECFSQEIDSMEIGFISINEYEK